MIKAALPQLKHTPVGKRLEMKINEMEAGIDGDNEGVDQGEGIERDYIPLSHSTSTSPTMSDTVSGNDTSLTEDTGITSSDIGLYSPESMSKSVKANGHGNGSGNGKGKQKMRGRREDEELEELLQ
jgi:hypothetical protein